MLARPNSLRMVRASTHPTLQDGDVINSIDSQQTDAIFADSDSLDSVIGCFDNVFASLLASSVDESEELQAEDRVPFSLRSTPARSKRKRRIPWLGI